MRKERKKGGGKEKERDRERGMGEPSTLQGAFPFFRYGAPDLLFLAQKKTSHRQKVLFVLL